MANLDPNRMKNIHRPHRFGADSAIAENREGSRHHYSTDRSSAVSGYRSCRRSCCGSKTEKVSSGSESRKNRFLMLQMCRARKRLGDSHPGYPQLWLASG